MRGVAYPEVLVAVVHEQMHPGGRLCQLAGPPRPLRQFCLAIEVAEPLGGAHIAGVPGAVGPPVEPDDGQVVPGGGQHGGEPGNGRGVDHHGGQAEISQEVERPLAIGFFPPLGRAQLNASQGAPEAFGQAGQLVAVGAPRHEPWRVLEQHRPEAASFVQRAQGVQEPRPHFFQRVGRQMMGIDAALFGHIRRQLLADIWPQRGRVDGVPSQHPVSLYVEAKAVRDALGPRAGQFPGRGPVIGGVRFDQRKLPGVVAQPVLRAHRTFGVPSRLLGQGRVRPRARAHHQRGSAQRHYPGRRRDARRLVGPERWFFGRRQPGPPQVPLITRMRPHWSQCSSDPAAS